VTVLRTYLLTIGSQIEKLRAREQRRVFFYDERDWKAMWQRLQPFFSMLEIRVAADPSAPVRPSFSTGIKMLPTTDALARAALDKKISKYRAAAKDLILVIHYDADPFIGKEIDWIKAEVARDPGEFREIWVLRDTTVPAATARCVYRREDNASEGKA